MTDNKKPHSRCIVHKKNSYLNLKIVRIKKINIYPPYVFFFYFKLEEKKKKFRKNHTVMSSFRNF